MAAQDIYITPKQILSYLKDFEEKLPIPQQNHYVSTLTSTPLTIDALNQEVNQMARFIGLKGFTANCKWAKLPSGIGGQIQLDGSRSGYLNIDVNDEYKNEKDVTAATLAHELCHKYLQLHGIYFPQFTEINETYTDLCTMYVGFGNIILKGYSTDKWKCGYLQFPIYKRTHRLVRAIIWGEVPAIMEDYAEPFLEEALGLWVRNRDKKMLSRKEYKNTFKEISDYQRNVEIFKQLLYMLEEAPLKLAEEVDTKMYKPDWFDEEGQLKRKVACFVGIYEGIIIRERFKDTPIHKINRHLAHLIAQMVDAVGRSRFPNNKIYRLYFECPYCKHRALSSKIANSETIVKCPNCKKRFAVNGEAFDLIPARNDFDKFNNELMNPIRKALEDSKEKMKKDSYLQGFADGKTHKGKEVDALKKKIEELPFWIKWLLGSRLK